MIAKDRPAPSSLRVVAPEEQRADLTAYLKERGYHAIRAPRSTLEARRQAWIMTHLQTLLLVASYPRYPALPSSDDPDFSGANATMRTRISTAKTTIYKFLNGTPSPSPTALVLAVLTACHFTTNDPDPDTLTKLLRRHRSPAH